MAVNTGALRELFLFLGVELDEKGLDQANKGLENLKKTAKRVAVVFLTGVVVKGFKNLVDLASEASESANKFEAVFKEAGEETRKSLMAISDATGIASLELIKMTSNIGALIKPALGSSRAAGEMAANITSLALDIASFNDVTSDEALLALRSGLIGSAEPLQRFGVDVRAAALQQEALRQGVRGNIKDLTEGQRVQLRYNAILRQLQTQGALGDAAKTSRGFANASRALTTQLRQLGARIGGFLLPFAEKSTQQFLALAKATGEWVKTNENLIRQNVGRVFKVLNGILGALVTSVKFMIRVWEGFADVVGKTNAAIIGVALVFAILAVALGLPLILLGLIGVAIFAIVEDLIAMGEDGTGAIATLIKGFEDLVDETGSVAGAIEAMLGTAANAWLKYFGVAKETRENLKLLYQDMKDDAFAFFGVIGKGFSTIAFVLGKVDDLLRDVSKTLSLVLNKTIGFFGGGDEAQTPAKGGAGAGALKLFSGGVPALAGGGGALFSAAPVSGGQSTQNNINVSVSIEAGGISEPEVLASMVGDVVSREVPKALEQQARQTAQAFKVGK